MTNADVRAPGLPWDGADPYPFYEQRRRTGDVVWDDTAHGWLILGYGATRTILTGPHWTSDPRATGVNLGPWELNSAALDATMLFTDGATHARLRSAVHGAFSPSVIGGLHTGIDAICTDAISTIPAGEPIDLMADIALPLPIAVIGAWLGLDTDQCASLRLHSPAIIRVLGGFADDNQLREGVSASAALIAELLPAAADRRAHPRDDLLSFLATAPTLSLDDVVVTAILIAIAGHETTANLLGASLIRLLTPASAGTRLAETIDPTDPAVFTELLRLDAPAQAVARTATDDQTVAGVEIGHGHTVLACIAAANRDPAVYDDPHLFRPDRSGPPPLSFGHGVHYCLGAALARLETTTALSHILRRHPVLDGAPTWRDTPAVRGPQHVPVTFRK